MKWKSCDDAMAAAREKCSNKNGESYKSCLRDLGIRSTGKSDSLACQISGSTDLLYIDALAKGASTVEVVNGHYIMGIPTRY